jgi:phage gp36-like protein
MGAYVTSTNILDIVPMLPQTTTASGYSNTSMVVDRHITRAESYVNGKLSQRYDVPFTSTAIPPLVKTITEDIATFYVFRSLFTQDNQNYNEYLESYKTADELLKEIQSGDIDVILSTGETAPEKSGSDNEDISSNVTGKSAFFNVDNSLDWKFDDELLDDIRDKR